MGQKGFLQYFALLVLALAIVGIIIGIQEVRRTQTLRSQAAQLNNIQNFRISPSPLASGVNSGSISEYYGKDIGLQLYELDNFTPLDLPALTGSSAIVRVGGRDFIFQEDWYKVYLCVEDKDEIPRFDFADSCISEDVVHQRGNNSEAAIYSIANIKLSLKSTDVANPPDVFEYRVILADRNNKKILSIPIKIKKSEGED